MKNNIRPSLFVIGLFFTLSAFAQTSAKKSTNQLNSLLHLNGYWEAPGTSLQMGGKEYNFTYYADFKKAAGNRGLVMNEWCNIPGLGKLSGTNLLGIDPYDGKVHWYTVDNMGTTHEHIGEFTDDKHFTMVHKGIRDGKEYIETISLEYKAADKINLQLVATLDGKEEEAIKGTFQRKLLKGQ